MASTLRIDLASSTPLYEQFANGLRAELVAGRFAAGTKLPTVRTLAVGLGVHHNTVAQAFRQLASEGWLELRRRGGARVRDRQRPRATPEAREHFRRSLRELVARALADGFPAAALAREMLDRAHQLEESP